MMNKITSFLTFSLVLVYHISYAQVDSYIKAIYSAEEKIMDGSFHNAVDYYKDAFKFSEQILFAKDVHNAMLCAVYVDDKESFTSFVNLYRKFDLSETMFSEEDESQYDPEFVKKILERAESVGKGNVIKYTDELRKELFGKL